VRPQRLLTGIAAEADAGAPIKSFFINGFRELEGSPAVVAAARRRRKRRGSKFRERLPIAKGAAPAPFLYDRINRTETALP
jgi:hypothetical protein